jgi:prevent-host-death family protein
MSFGIVQAVSGADATFMYMSDLVGVAELRQNLSVYLRRVREGETLVVTDRNRPVAVLGPAPESASRLDQLIAAGRVSPPLRAELPEPLEMGDDPGALSRALAELRDDER